VISTPPDDLAGRSYLKEAVGHAVIDQRVSVGQPLRVGDTIAVDTLTICVLVPPDDLVRRRIDLDHARKRKRLIQAGGAVIEYENVAIGQTYGCVLAG